MESLLADLRFAYRSLAKRRTFTIVSILTIALGIGPTATMYSVVSGILLNPLGYHDPGRLIAISARFGITGDVPLSTPEFTDLKEQEVPKLFTSIASSYPVVGNLTGADRPERIGSVGATGDYFNLLGVKPVLGRTWNPAEETPGITQIMVISYDLWQERFGGKRDVLGKQVRIDDDQYDIIGVMPRGFTHPGSTRAQPVQMWYLCGFRGTPFPQPNRAGRPPGTVVFARLAPGVTLEHAQSELTRIAASWSTADPTTYPARIKGFSLRVMPVNDVIVATPIRRGVIGLLIGVSLVLLIACANVAGLQLMRGFARAGEITVRGALGATRLRLVRQLITESVLVGVVGGAVGVLLATGLVALVRARLPDTMPRASDITVNMSVVAIGIAATIVLTALFGIVPALTSTRVSLASTLRSSAAASIGSASRARTILVVSEIALAVTLLTGAGLFLRSYWALERVDPGFRTDHMMTLQMAIPYPNHPEQGKYTTAAQRIPYYTEVLRRVREAAGVEKASFITVVPFTPPVFQGTQGAPFSAEGADIADPAAMPRTQTRVIAPGYFDLLQVRMKDGRDFRLTDDTLAAPVVIVNETLAGMAWPHENPVGKRLALGVPGTRQRLATVVAVVNDYRSLSLDAPDGPMAFFPYTQALPFQVGLMVRTKGAPELVQSAITAVVQGVEPDQPLFGAATMDDLLGSDVAQRRFAMLAVSAFAALAITLSGIGIYGLIAFTVSQRTRELGLRLALGSTPAAALALVFKQGFRLALTGVVIGGALAAIGAQSVRTMIYGVNVYDPLAFLAAPVLLLAVAALACWAPARRAASVDAIVALRMD